MGLGNVIFFSPSEELRRFKRRGLQNRQYRPYDLHDFVMAGAPLQAARARGEESCRTTIWAMALTIHGFHCSTASAVEFSFMIVFIYLLEPWLVIWTWRKAFPNVANRK